MSKAGSLGQGKEQLHNMYKVKEFNYKDNPFEITIGYNLLRNDSLRGRIEVDAANNPEYMSDSGSIEWDLRITKQLSYDVGYGSSKLLRSIHAF